MGIRSIPIPTGICVCPFCGTQPKVYKMSRYHIVCDSEDCRDVRFVEAWGDTINEALQNWNWRR